MSSQTHKKWWKARMEDWNQAYLSTADHPHRQMIMDKLRKTRFQSLLEVGCNAGPNLLNIAKKYPLSELGGLDINAGSIEMARNRLPKNVVVLEVGSADSLPFSDKSVDIILTDATLIYIDNKEMDKVMKEIVRVVRNNVIFFEAHSESAWERFKIRRQHKNYYIHDYYALLEKYGFWDIEITKMPPKLWENSRLWENWGCLISARI